MTKIFKHNTEYKRGFNNFFITIIEDSATFELIVDKFLGVGNDGTNDRTVESFISFMEGAYMKTKKYMDETTESNYNIINKTFLDPKKSFEYYDEPLTLEMENDKFYDELTETDKYKEFINKINDSLDI